MYSVAEKLPQIEKMVMSGLKDFQVATVNKIDERYRSGYKRVLVSDEVGLGKTLIARGTIAKFARLRKEQGDDLVKVVYICSNTAIADQNLSKLQIHQKVKKEKVSYSRLSMQHLNIYNQENDPESYEGYIQLIPLTPDTSFRVTAGKGTVDERALMFQFLKRIPSFKNYREELEIAMTDIAYGAWNSREAEYNKKVKDCNKDSNGRYIIEMVEALEKELDVVIDPENEPDVTLRDCVKDMLKNIRKYGVNNNSYVIGQLRFAFSRISLDKLDPDLVIMDEFQRFKYLLSAEKDSDIGMLTNKFFNTDDVYMLLLSATPYKMYSTLEEIDETQIDEHYSEFLKVMDFLNNTENNKIAFKEIWNDYSIQLKEFCMGNIAIVTAKKAAEDALYSRICRTERISAEESADIIDDSDVKTPITVVEQDILSYIQIHNLLEEINAPKGGLIEYAKSSPYLLSFMRDYRLKKYVEEYFKSHPEEINKVKKSVFWLDRNKLDKYDKIPNGNARLDRVMDTVLEKNSELLLWLPPSKPYYAPQGVYKNAGGFTKTLVFSSWEMVPRMLASLISYESERKTVGKLAEAREDKTAHYFSSGERRYPAPRLTFSVSRGKEEASNERLRGMPLFCLIYPSEFLANCYDPVECMNNKMTLKEIEKNVANKIQKILQEKTNKIKSVDSGKPDDRWYYLAPLLFDGVEYALKWLDCSNELAAYDDDEDTNRRNKGFITHFDKLEMFYFDVKNRGIPLGKKPNDLIKVLVDMAIASPAVCIKRTYDMYTKEQLESTEEYPKSYYYMPSQIARLFINRMNTVESTAAVELACGRKSDDAHWQDVLTYCKFGNIQAMFDEYAHLISNGLDKDSHFIEKMHSAIADSMNLRTTIYNIDTFNAFKARCTGTKEKATNIRSHYAVAFTKGDSKEASGDRKNALRNAFNSPFRPFVLASTSIAQEGLDFHNYCRRIVHWNLPANPIDLEQREGRINRYKGLAIRQNIALRYGDISFKDDIWNEMFEYASKEEKSDSSSDLIPYWGLRKSDDMVKIERIVPMYPLSKDEMRYDRLIKILSLYRLTLGQARQEELLDYFFENREDDEDMKDMFINLSPYFRDD